METISGEGFGTYSCHTVPVNVLPATRLSAEGFRESVMIFDGILAVVYFCPGQESLVCCETL